MINKVRWWVVKRLVNDRAVLMNVSFTVVGDIKSNGKKGLVHKCSILKE
jgi:hypothetical protein